MARSDLDETRRDENETEMTDAGAGLLGSGLGRLHEGARAKTKRASV